jgi:hypothetical protein
MHLSRSVKILAIILGVILVALFAYILFINERGGEPLSVPVDTSSNNPDTATGITATDPNAPVRRIIVNERPDAVVPIQKFGKEDLIRLSMSFAERFGSYSNQSNYTNVIDLKLFMSDKMRVWADDFVAQQRRADKDTSIYFGITTTAVANELLTYDEDLGTASVKVETRRREATGTTGNLSDPYGQRVTVTFVKERGTWKVDSAFWDDEKS